jgi:tetratricopeptide (TPR) repeat protein
MPQVPASRRLIFLLLFLAANLGLLAWIGWLLLSRPTDHWAEAAEAKAQLGRGRPDLAFQAVSSIRDEGPGSAEALTLAARSLLMLNNVALARKTLERSLQMQPDQPEAVKMLAAIYLASGDGTRGLDLLKKASRLDPGDFRPWFAMAKVYLDLGEFSEAADAYAATLRRSPPPAEAREARIGRVRALLDSHRDAEAADDIDVIRRRYPDDAEVLSLAARQAHALGRFGEALDLADGALASDPESFDARLVRAQIHHREGRPEQALADLESATRINPNHVGALQLLAQVQTRLGRSDQAKATLERTRKTRERLALMDRLTREIHEKPDDPEPRWRMGQAAVEGGMETLAYQCFQAALDVDPTYGPAREALDELRERGEGPDRSLGTLIP